MESYNLQKTRITFVNQLQEMGLNVNPVIHVKLWIIEYSVKQDGEEKLRANKYVVNAILGTKSFYCFWFFQ